MGCDDRYEAYGGSTADPREAKEPFMAKAIDMVNAPPHYTFGGPQYEVILVIEAWGLDKDFLLANAVKYIARAGKKNPEKEVEDLEKAQWYLERKINNLKHEAREAASKAFDKLTMKGSK